MSVRDGDSVGQLDNLELTTTEDSDSDSDSNRVFDSHPPRESKDEPKKILEMRAELASDLDLLDESQRYPELVHDWKMLRFLRGYQGSVTKACKAYREMLEFRTTIDAAGMRTEILAAAAANGDLGSIWTYNFPRFSKIRDGIWKGAHPAVLHGFDKHGSLVVLSFVATYRWNEIIHAELGDTWQDLVLYCDMHLDLLLHKLSVERNRMVARRDVVDAANMKSSQLGMSVVRLLSKMSASSKHYPEALCRTDVCNFSAVASTVLGFVKPFLPPQTRRKLFGHRDAHAIEGIDPKSLPQRLEGACACVQCRTYVDQIWNHVSVSARSTHTVEVYVHASDVGLLLCSQVTVQSNDIALSVTFAATTTAPADDQSTEAQQEIVLKEELVTSKDLEYKCTTPGTYRIHMSNTHSYLRSKSVTHRSVFS
eukprot:m.28383 g.28383  ORF g.28383 m.28383 type:complete len:424 (-) comp15908_c1_seq1:109-1380(-)